MPSNERAHLGHHSNSQGEETNGAVKVTDNLEVPSLDDRSYRVVRLHNDLEALLVHDATADKAAASLDVNVGNFSDEDDMPGMAHAVEHLLFMGTEKYPVENEYPQYLAANSGSSNAYTGGTSTNYHFEVSGKPANDEEATEDNPSPLRGALDRFAQFFVAPLFLEGSLDRELQAVDSENKKNLQSDTWRLNQLEKATANPKHPYCHFSTGNLEVLKTIPESRGIVVRDKFIEFYQKHYSANLMKLVVLGRESLDVLEKWVVEFFSDVPNKKLPQNRWPDELPLRKEDLGILIFAKPVMDSREISLFFPFLDEEHMYETQPSRYVSHLIGHEGPGSLFAYLKSKGWAIGLNAGAYPVSPGSPGIFDCQIRLTEDGLANYREIIKAFFQYVALLREQPPQKWIFDEQKGISDMNFKFKQKSPAMRFAMKASGYMQKPVPREWLLSSRLRTFDAKLIQEAIDCLRPDNFRCTIVSQHFPGGWDKKEKWYGTEYKIDKIPGKLMRDIVAAAATTSKERLPVLHLPHKNNFIPANFDVEKKDVKEPAVAPRLVRHTPRCRTWFKKDDTFWVPKANVVAYLRNPIIYASAATAVMTRIYTELVKDALEEYAYDADLAGLSYTVSFSTKALFLDISGYNDKLSVLLEQVLKTMRDVEIKPDRFAIVKERLKRAYDNTELQMSYHQVGNYVQWLGTERSYVVEDFAAELPSITVEAVHAHKHLLLGQAHLELYVHGNLHKQAALQLTDLIQSTLCPRPLPEAQWPTARSLILPPGANYVYKRPLKDPANVNHCIEYVLFTGDRGDRATRAKTQLLEQMVHEPAYDQLRTKEQLGYIVFSGARTLGTQYAFRFLLQSDRLPQYLETRVDAFIHLFDQQLQDMTKDEFEAHKRSLIVRRLKKLENLDAESSRQWSQIASEYFDFNVARLDADSVKRLTKQDMVDFWKHFIHTESPHRSKLVVQLFAQGDAESQQRMKELMNVLSEETDEVKEAVRSALMHAEMRGGTTALQDLLAGLKLSDEKTKAVLAASRDPATEPKADESADQPLSNRKAINGVAPTVIDNSNVRQFKASLPLSSGPSPVQPLSEFEDNEAKL